MGICDPYHENVAGDDTNRTYDVTPVLVISASDDVNLRGLALGGSSCLLKPLSSDWLLQEVRRQLPFSSGKSVLVVDDDPAFRRQVVECLRTEDDLTIDEATTGREALDRMSQRMPDLLLLDLLMPDMDGFDVLQALRADRRAVNLPVVVVTGKDLTDSERRRIKTRLATLVSKREASLDYFARVVAQTLKASPAMEVPEPTI